MHPRSSVHVGHPRAVENGPDRVLPLRAGVPGAAILRLSGLSLTLPPTGLTGLLGLGNLAGLMSG